ncbi:citryl-CoA lyase [Brevibacterium antiquum]|uniref:citrate synthase (unknown stereospecificity) n=1 Tax=Brevibacterium antiquum CNRZ 918 TaxID=1255637 RepID=A0A2H1L0C1_9MICO|nr:citryl-CoA lyase [Brevibacterium antiquum]SMY05401.1 citrate synthase [Brevibacterium antiquum CNRZ 918]
MLRTITNERQIIIGGTDLNDLMSQLDFVEMWLFLHTGRRCTEAEKTMINALMVSLMDHGVTPTTVAARMTMLSAPDSLQGAVASGILGAGDRFLGVTENVTRSLYVAGYDAGRNGDVGWVHEAADRLMMQDGQIHGIGHNIHSGTDPRVSAVIDIAKSLGMPLEAWKVLELTAEKLSEKKQRKFVVNNAGAVGAAIAALGLEPEFARGLSVVARAAGLVVHAIDEKKSLESKKLWERLVAEENNSIQEGDSER